jgi:hypothetical protein
MDISSRTVKQNMHTELLLVNSFKNAFRSPVGSDNNISP